MLVNDEFGYKSQIFLQPRSFGHVLQSDIPKILFDCDKFKNKTAPNLRHSGCYVFKFTIQGGWF
ncbi:hypothetical protein SUT286_01390 [Streptococcus parasuis]|nr:hypothetical protein SUT286_01390 [Streptococcus parasuis]